MTAGASGSAVCGRSLVGTAGSNPAGNMGACLLRVLYVGKKKSLRLTDHPSREIPLAIVYLPECDC